ncbi:MULTISPECIES: hypothetical protein [Streptomyces]|uniref:hypothetical protein n=1 Tax=Streptomyces TaxID=1883 RepID=UPI001489F968|nr:MULTISPECIES: hypothetical protein [Streptomyces]
MPHRMLRSAATALLASAPLVAAVPAQAAPQQVFPCDVSLQKLSNNTTTVISASFTCSQDLSVSVKIAAGDIVFVNVQKAVRTGVQESVTVAVPRTTAEVCATLKAGDQSTEVCS